MEIGLSCVPMNVLIYMKVGVMLLRNYTHSMRVKEEAERLLKLNGYGVKSLRVNWKQEHLICFTKMLAIERAINKIWEQSRVLIYVLK